MTLLARTFLLALATTPAWAGAPMAAAAALPAAPPALPAVHPALPAAPPALPAVHPALPAGPAVPAVPAAPTFAPPALSAVRAAPVPLAAPARPDGARPRSLSSVSLPQCFIEEGEAFLVVGDGLAACVEPGALRWIVAGTADGAAPRSVVTVEPVGARDVAPAGERPLAGVVSRFHGRPEEWRAGRRTFGAVRYAGLWDGIDLLLEADGQMLKGTYVVAPGADPSAVRLRHRGADGVVVDDAGRLVIRTPSGAIVDAAPVAWQHVGGERRDVPVAFAIEPAPGGATDVVFALGAHDPCAALLIDPAVVVQAGFLGGAADDFPAEVVVGDDGCVYLAGSTRSTEATFPVVVGPDLTWGGAPAPHGDAYVAKLDPTGTTLLYCGFIGGTKHDMSDGLAVDSLGRAYVGGSTASDDTDGFPATGGPQVVHGGNYDAWVARVSVDGTSLEYCGWIGGNSDDRLFDLDIDDAGRLYVVGRFSSLPTTLPLFVGPYLTQPGGATDAFIARVSATADFEYCGYLGGNNLDDITEVAADGTGGAWFAGYTWSQDFPTVGPLGPTGNGSIQAVVGRVLASGGGLTVCGLFGGAASEFPAAIALDAAGAVYVSGLTSGTATFPTLVGPSLVPSGTSDGFLTKIAPDGNSIVWSGFTNTGSAAEIIVGEDQAVWFVDTPTTGTIQTTVGRVPSDGTSLEVIATLPMPTGTRLEYLDEVPSALTPGSTDLWITGWTTATQATFPVVSGPDVTANGLNDTVLVRLAVADEAWTDLGFALAGTHGAPVLEGTGTLAPLSPLELSLSNALESAPVWLVIGVGTLYAPFRGGTLVPDPAPPGFVVGLFTSPAGGFDLMSTWPAGVPSGFSIYLQCWVQDAAGPAGMSASNGLRGTTP